MKEDNIPIYAPETLAFVTTATQFCIYLEQREAASRLAMVTALRSFLPALYAQGGLLPEVCAEEYEDEVEVYVTEADYNMVRHHVAAMLGEQDDYLEVFVADMKYSDTPILQTISEGIADLYQVLRDFVEIYKQGFDEAMLIALAQIRDQYGPEWGQVLVNVLRALHDVQFNQHIAQEEEA